MPVKKVTTSNPKQLMALLKQGNADRRLLGAGVGQAKLMKMLHSLPPLERDDSTGLLARLERSHPKPGLSSNEYYILSFVDGCVRQILNRASLDPELEWLILRFTPHVAFIALAGGPEKLFDASPVFRLIDLLCKYCRGWNSDLGVLGETSVDKLEKLVKQVSVDPKTQRTRLKEIKDYIEREDKRFSDMEDEFRNAELKKLESAKMRDRVARLINQEMKGDNFPFFLVLLLQGGWLDFVQSVLLDKGSKSKEWTAAQQLTRKLIWSLKDHTRDNASQRTKLRGIIKNLPSSARALAKRVDIDMTATQHAIADIEAEYDAVLRGKPSECGEFTPIEIQESSSKNASESTRLEISKIDAKPGEWFYYEDSDRESSRLKLILSWQKKQMLFTNHNRKSAITIAYEDFCASLAAGVIRQLPPVPPCTTIVREYVERLLKGKQQQKAESNKRKKAQVDMRKKAQEERRKKADATIRKKVVVEKLKKEERAALQKRLEKAKKLVAATEAKRSKLSLDERKAALTKEMAEIRKVETARNQKAVKQKRAGAKKKVAAGNKQLITAEVIANANDAIRGLGKGAKVILGSETGELIICKLLTKMLNIDKFIFVDRGGIKVAQHGQQALVTMFLDGKLEILSRGEKFEDTLASVVRGLRNDRDRLVAD
jgi:hypothetical protein